MKKNFLLFLSLLLFSSLVMSGFLIMDKWNMALASHDEELAKEAISSTIGGISISDFVSINKSKDGASIKQDPFNFLLLVSDASSGCTDTMIIFNFDPQKGILNSLSIPRDTQVISPAGKKSKINSIYAIHGISALAKNIKDLMGIEINYYFYFDIKTVRGVIDMLDGVEFDVPFDMKYTDPDQDLYINLKKGKQVLDGNKAEQFLRFRKSNNPTKEELKYYNGSDISRMKMQMEFLNALIDQKANLTYLLKANDIIAYIFKTVKTNIQLENALTIFASAQSNIENIKNNNINSFSLNGTDKTEGGLWYFIYDHNFVTKDGSTISEANARLLYFRGKDGLTK